MSHRIAPRRSYLIVGLLLAVSLCASSAYASLAKTTAHADGVTIEVSVEGFEGVLPTLHEGKDFRIGSPVKADPRYMVDDQGNSPLATLVEQREKQGFTLTWVDESNEAFDWFSTPITTNKQIQGRFVSGVFELRVVFNDDAKSADLVVSVEKGSSFMEAHASQPPTPHKTGYAFKGWVDSTTGEAFDFDAPVNTSSTIIASYQLDNASLVETFDPTKDIPTTLEGSCFIGETWGVHPAQFSISEFTGGLSGCAGTGQCSLPSAAAPSFTYASYRATLQNVDVLAGKVTYDVHIVPPGAASIDGPRNELGLIGYQTVSFSAVIEKSFGGYLRIGKSSGNTTLSNDNACYSLEGGVFGVFDQTGNKVAELRTDSEGNSPQSPLLPVGTYTIKEETAPPGYAGADTDKTLTVVAGSITTVPFVNLPKNNPVDVVVEKIDAEAQENLCLGAGSLEGARFALSYYDGYYESAQSAKDSGGPSRSWVITTDSLGYARLDDSALVEGDPFYHDSKGAITLPLGTLLIEEIEAPHGYNLSREVKCCSITDEGEIEHVKTFSLPTYENHVIRGDISFSKVNEESMERLRDIPFTITSQTTGETHRIVSDENGMVDTAATWTPHTHNTNAGNDSEDGLWFGLLPDGRDTQPDDERGALPFDTYFIQEQRCSENAGLDLISFEITISREAIDLDLGTIDDRFIPPEPIPEEEMSLEDDSPLKTLVKTGEGIPLMAVLSLALGVGALGALSITRRVRRRQAFRTMIHERYRRF